MGSEPTGEEFVECRSPATGEVIGHWSVTSPRVVRQTVERSRQAQARWAEVPTRERASRMLQFRDALVRNAPRLADTLVRECGKPRQEALLHEVGVLCSALTYYSRNAESLLAPETVIPHLLKHRRSVLHYVPRGVVGVISPWNFPLMIPYVDAVTALFAGNSAVIKPSEHASLIALEAKRVWDESGLDPDLIQVVTGRGETGQALIEGGAAKIIFTGGPETGPRVAAECAKNVVECVLELGGKAPAIVCDDANVSFAARAITYGGFYNAGQACVSVERVLAHESIAEELVGELVTLADGLRVGGPEGVWDVGPLIYEPGRDRIEALLQDAVERGASIVFGGQRVERRGCFFHPTVVANCTPDMRIMREEIFGPVIPVMSVRDDAHALDIANSLPIGLNGYVFTKDVERGRGLASRLQVGSVVINDVLSDYGAADVPFGGIKKSGYGKTHGAAALRSMCHVKHVGEPRLPPPTPAWFPYSERGERLARQALHALFSSKSPLSRLLGRF